VQQPEGAEILRSGKQPAPSRHRSRPLSQTVRRLAQAPPAPFIDGRKSVASPPTPICVQNPRGPKSSRSGKRLPRRAIALGYSRRPCAGSRKHRRPRLSMVENRSRRAHTNMRAKPEGAEILRSGNTPAPSRHRSQTLPRPCAGSRKHRRPRLSMVENRSRRRATPICVQRPEGAEILRSGKQPAPSRHRSQATFPDRAPARASTADPVHRWSKIGCSRAPTPICVQNPRGPKS